MRSKVAQRILAETPEETKIFARMYADIVVRVNQLLKSKGFNQKDLAQRMEKRPSEINKWLVGEHNFTLRSLAKLESELGDVIINIPQNKPLNSCVGEKRYITVYKNTHAVKTDVTFKKAWRKSKTKPKKQLANVS
jgi:ribosome-binding protein aMBF1 (putative translation factor)